MINKKVRLVIESETGCKFVSSKLKKTIATKWFDGSDILLQTNAKLGVVSICGGLNKND